MKKSKSNYYYLRDLEDIIVILPKKVSIFCILSRYLSSPRSASKNMSFFNSENDIPGCKT